MVELTTKELFKLLAPFLILTVLVSFLAFVLFLRFSPLSSPQGPLNVVTFDIVRYTNAQRAVAAVFLNKGADQGMAAETLTGLSDRTHTAIMDVAGPGTVVLLKQAVVQGQMRDITSAVLKKLRLPTDVPTSDAAAYAIDIAPTMWITPPLRKEPNRLPGEKMGAPEVLP
jgi:hypothetical protein